MADPTIADDTGGDRARDYPGVPRWVKRSGLVVGTLILLASVLRLTGVHGGGHGPLGHGPGMHAAVGGEVPGAGTDVDRQFIDMMVPHHQGAVAMARIAQQRAEHPEIAQLAEGIISSQEAEITRMQGWRSAWYGSDQTPPLSQMPMLAGTTGHSEPGATMDMAADVERLRQANAPFDRAFVDAMIPHHRSAIDAARIAQAQAQRPEIRDLAAAIIAGQQREIDQMERWRQSWYGVASSRATAARPPRVSDDGERPWAPLFDARGHLPVAEAELTTVAVSAPPGHSGPPGTARLARPGAGREHRSSTFGSNANHDGALAAFTRSPSWSSWGVPRHGCSVEGGA